MVMVSTSTLSRGFSLCLVLPVLLQYIPGIPAIKVKTPVVVFSGYLDSQEPALQALGDEIDYFKRMKEIYCPVGGEDDADGHGLAYPTSLHFYIDVLHRGMFEFENFMEDLNLLSRQDGLQRLGERFGFTSFPQAWQFRDELFARYKTLRGYVKVFIKYGRGINRVPGRLTPLDQPESQNLANLVSRIEDAKRDGQGNIEFDTDARERFKDQWDGLAGYANGGSLKMEDAHQWAIMNLMGAGFTDLIRDMDPDEEDVDDTPEEEEDRNMVIENIGLQEEQAEDLEEEQEEEQGQSEMEGFAGPDEVQVVLQVQVQNNMELEQAEAQADEDSDSSDANDDDGQGGGVEFNFAEVFRRAGLWFQCWRNQAVRIYQLTDELEPVPYPPQWQEILEEGD
ncbi:hypothetical protein TWF696_005104 [Orbilia brochopaga]|uniref:Uncharacterized protein n=1 Tax=Orbilia brochopaga TaxID=3140254 RepID=A0AAV9V0H1_9PEZI